jgi:hypothetical protein
LLLQLTQFSLQLAPALRHLRRVFFCDLSPLRFLSL